jgi:hypothetical protein
MQGLLHGRQAYRCAHCLSLFNSPGDIGQPTPGPCEGPCCATPKPGLWSSPAHPSPRASTPFSAPPVAFLAGPATAQGGDARRMTPLSVSALATVSGQTDTEKV